MSTSAGAYSFPRVGLPGANDPSCTSDDPPVLLLHGTLSTPAGNFQQINAALQADGRCVYALTYGKLYGFGGMAPVRTSAEQVSAFAQQVLAATGAEQLDIVAYSQGGLVARTMLSGLTGTAGSLDPASVRSLVMVSPSYHGTTSAIATNVPATMCAACADQVVGSSLLRDLDGYPDLAGDVRYAVLSSRYDVVVTPVSAQAPDGPPDRVTSVVLEDVCPIVSNHLDLVHELPVARWVAAAVATGGRPTPADLGC